MTLPSYNVTMKTENEIEIKKIRKQLQQNSITQEEKAALREHLAELKKRVKLEKLNLIEDV